MRGFGSFFDVFLSGVWTAVFCACQIIFASTIFAWPPGPFYTVHARLNESTEVHNYYYRSACSSSPSMLHDITLGWIAGIHITLHYSCTEPQGLFKLQD